jgi:type III pantothenate kinase
VRATADFLLIDVSNSFTKFAFASRQRVGAARKILTSNLSSAFLASILRRRSAHTIVVSSVVPQRNRILRGGAGKHPTIWLNARSRLNIAIDYPEPKTIGADRLANAVAVTELYGSPAIVIDFGTAVTFDIVSAQAAYIGGVIAPGLEGMTNFLYQRTALLPRISLREPRSAVGKTTREAMIAGAVFGYRGLVQEVLRRIVAQEFGDKHVHIVATGGYAELMAGKMPEIESVHESLTLEGLRIVGCLNTTEAAGGKKTRPESRKARI